jgi:tetratricopeptide (TPR) repeat protein
VVTDRLRADDVLPQVIADAADLLGRATFGEEQAWDRRGEGDQLVAHIAALSTNAGSASASLSAEATERVLGLRQWATRQLSAVGDGGRAVELAESIRTECETLLGPEHPDSLAASDNLVIAYVAAGRAADGIGLAEDVLDARERVLGADNLDTLASRYTVAYAHEYAGQLDEAASRYDRAYTEYARVLGADNPQTFTVAGALARVRAMQPAARGRHRSGQRPA